jgi:hypothetical protein
MWIIAPSLRSVDPTSMAAGAVTEQDAPSADRVPRVPPFA